MTNEKMLEVLYRVKSLLECGDESEAIRVMLSASETVKEDIRHDCQKSKGIAKRDKLATKVMDNVPSAKPLLKGYHVSGRLYAICDGYRAYVTSETFGFPKAESQKGNLERLIPTAEKFPVKVDVSLVKAYLKDQKALVKAKKQRDIHPYVLKAPSFRIGFNPQYLIEFCQFFNTDTVLVSAPISPCYYRDDKNDDWGILLPCRIKNPYDMEE